jgi:hypothetical protein
MTSATRLDDGFSTIITLENLPTVKLYEKEVTPPGITSGGPIETTTMRTTVWRTNAPRQLKSLSPVSATVAFATEVVPQMVAQVGVNQLITVTFPDGSTIEFYGWIEEFTPAAFTEGEQPTATLTVQPSLTDPDTGDTVAPVYDPFTGST